MTQEIGGFAALGLHPNILAALTAVGYEEPSPIQSQAIPVILAGDYNIIPAECDVYNPDCWRNDALFLPEVRKPMRPF